MAKWTIQVNTGAGFTAYKYKRFDFQLALNQMGRAHAVLLPGTTAPDEGDEWKIIWDLGGAGETVWFRGAITSKQKDDFSGLIEVWGYDDSFSLYQSQLGASADYGLRKYAAQTPYAIIQGAGSPLGLLYNGQGNLVMAYGTSAPNAITALNPGNALNFRAHTGRNLLNIGRLCEQATTGGGPTYGLEWFVDRDGADAKRFNLVSRRQRAAVYTNESFRLGVSIHKSPRMTETETLADRVKVVGEGSGSSRVESSWVGAGTRELVFSDKNVYDSTTATNLANRIYNSLSTGTSPRFMAKTHRAGIATRVGDDVDVVPKGGGGATAYRCLGIEYHSGERAWTLELGRSRRYFSSVLRDVERSLDAQDVHTQVTDTLPVLVRGGSSSVTASLAGAGVALASGVSNVLICRDVPPADFGRAEGYWLQIAVAVEAAAVRAEASNHVHTYDKANSPTNSTDAAGGGAVAEPHAHTLTYTSTNTGGTTPSVTIQGPFLARLSFVFADGSRQEVATFTLPHFPGAADSVVATNAFPFAVADAGGTDFSPTWFELDMSNRGPISVTVAVGASAAAYKRAIHRHNGT